MALVSEILDKAQRYLHDDGTLWPRTDLLEYFNHGFMRLLAETEAIRKLAAYDVPARRNRAISYPWERQYGGDGGQEFTLRSMQSSLGEVRCTYAWEVERNAGNDTPSDSAATCTQPWERIEVGTVEQSDRYVYPDNILSPFRVYFDSIRIHPATIRELDDYTSNWNGTASSRPSWYTAGLGSQGEFEAWPEPSTYTQAVAIDGRGALRSISGDKTYSFPSGVYGVIRGISGTNEYICDGESGKLCYGVPMAWQGTQDGILLDYSIHAPTLIETDDVSLLPSAFAKYLRYYVIARALGRSGEGENAPLSAHYEAKWQMGVKLLKRIAMLATSAKTYQNKAAEMRVTTLGRPRLPAEYPRIR